MPVIMPKSVTIDGVTYESYSQADKILGLPRGATSKRMAKERAMEQAEADLDDTAGHEPAQYKPEVLPEDISIAPPDGDDSTLTDELTAAVRGTEGVEESMSRPTGRPDRALVYDGVFYDTRREMADALGLEYLKLNACLRKYESVDEAVEVCRSGLTSHSIVYEGETHKSFKALCDAYNIAPALVRQLAEARGADKMDTFADIVTLGQSACIREDITITFIPAYVVQGVPFKNMKNMAETFDVDVDDMGALLDVHGLEGALLHLKNETITGFRLNGDTKVLTSAELLAEIESGCLEHFDLERKQLPKYPSLKDIDIKEYCIDIGELRESIGDGQYAQESLCGAALAQGPVMAGM